VQPAGHGPAVLFEAVGDFANELHVLYWTRPPTRFSERVTRSAVTERLFPALQEAGIDFPYPIRTVRLAGGQAAVDGPIHRVAERGGAGPQVTGAARRPRRSPFDRRRSRPSTEPFTFSG
jgi:hypothetical protein